MSAIPARRSRPHGQCHSRPGDGRGGTGEIRPSRLADGRGRYRDRAVHALSEIRSGRSGLARPRPFRAVGRPRLDADLRAVASRRLRGGDDRRASRISASSDYKTPGHPENFVTARRRDHHRPARPGHRQRGRHGDRGAASRGGVRQRDRRPPHLRARLRRRPDGRHQPGSDRARRAYASSTG